MAVKKQDAAQAAKTEEAKTAAAPEEGAAEQDTVVIRLFKDSHRYSEPVFVGVNGETYLVQRGVPVEVPKAVAEVLQHSGDHPGGRHAQLRRHGEDHGSGGSGGAAGAEGVTPSVSPSA